jgi:hypothetical protein
MGRDKFDLRINKTLRPIILHFFTSLKLDKDRGVAEFRRFAQIRLQSIIRFPDCNRQRPHKQLHIGTQSTKYNLEFYG